MKKTKRALAAVAACVMCASALGLAACGGKTPEEGTPDGTIGGITPAATYTVTFDANGGHFADAKTEVTATTKADGTVEWPTAPEYDDHTFVGYNLSADGTGTSVSSAYKYTANTKVYAQWESDGDGDDGDDEGGTGGGGGSGTPQPITRSAKVKVGDAAEAAMTAITPDTGYDRQYMYEVNNVAGGTEIKFIITDEDGYKLETIYAENGAQGLADPATNGTDTIICDATGGKYTIYLKHNSSAGNENKWGVWTAREDQAALAQERVDAMAASAKCVITPAEGTATQLDMENAYDDIDKSGGNTMDRKWVKTNIAVNAYDTISFNITDKEGYAVNNMWVTANAQGLTVSEANVESTVMVAQKGTLSIYLEHYSGNNNKYNITTTFVPDQNQGGGDEDEEAKIPLIPDGDQYKNESITVTTNQKFVLTVGGVKQTTDVVIGTGGIDHLITVDNNGVFTAVTGGTYKFYYKQNFNDENDSENPNNGKNITWIVDATTATVAAGDGVYVGTTKKIDFSVNDKSAREVKAEGVEFDAETTVTLKYDGATVTPTAKSGDDNVAKDKINAQTGAITLPEGKYSFYYNVLTHELWISEVVEGASIYFVRGDFLDCGWGAVEKYRMQAVPNPGQYLEAKYTLTVTVEDNFSFKIADNEWGNQQTTLRTDTVNGGIATGGNGSDITTAKGAGTYTINLLCWDSGGIDIEILWTAPAA